MPGSTLPNMGLVQPAVGGDAGTWGTENNAALAVIDAHSHKPGAGVPITTAAINIDGDLSFGSLYATTNLARAQFSAVATPANNLSLFVSNGSGGLVAGELYWRNNTGNPVRFTSGNALNFASFVGGIGGDYSAVGALEAFDDSQKQYTFKDGAAKWGRLHAGNVRLAPFGTASALFVEMAASASLASNYTVTWPSALPSTTLLMQMSNSGQIITNNTVPVDVVLGNVTASAVSASSVTVAANGNVTVSGTGDYKHGLRTLQVALPAVIANASFATNAFVFGLTSSNSVQIPLPMLVGSRIQAARIVMRDTSGTTFSLRIGFATVNGSSGITIGSGTPTSSGSGALQTLSATTSAPGLSVSSGQIYLAIVAPVSGPAAAASIYNLEVDYDRP